MDDSKAASTRGAPSGSLFVAEQQTHGKGRGQGRVWRSNPSGNLYFTLLLHPTSFSLLPVLNFALPLAVCQAITQLGVPNPKIKWPNDVWVNGLKVCGVLLDISSEGSKLYAHAGVGLNVNEQLHKHDDNVGGQGDDVQQQSLVSSATSLCAVLGRQVEREKLLAILCNELEQLLRRHTSVDSILPAYSQFDLLIDQRIIVMPKKKEDTSAYYEATAIGYSKDGYLRVRTDDGREQLLVSEEVSIRPNTANSSPSSVL